MIPENFIPLVLAFLAKIFIIGAVITTPIFYLYNRAIKGIKKQDKKVLEWGEMGAWDRIKLERRWEKENKNSIALKNVNAERAKLVSNDASVEMNDEIATEDRSKDISDLKVAVSKMISSKMKNNQLKRKEILHMKDRLVKEVKIIENKKYKNDLHCIYSIIKYSEVSEILLIEILAYVRDIDGAA